MKNIPFYMAAIAFIALLGIVGRQDEIDAEAAAAHRKETISAMRRQRDAAHKAEYAALLEQANRMMYPLAQASQ